MKFVKYDYVDVLKFILGQKAYDINCSCQKCIDVVECILKHGREKALTSFVDSGFDIKKTIKGDTLLHLAIKNKDYYYSDWVTVLVGLGLDVDTLNDAGHTALFFAQDASGIIYLTKSGASASGLELEILAAITNYNQILIVSALSYDFSSVDLMRSLIDHGFNVNAVMRDGRRPLKYINDCIDYRLSEEHFPDDHEHVVRLRRMAAILKEHGARGSAMCVVQ